MVAAMSMLVLAALLAVDFYEGCKECGGLRAYCAKYPG